MAGTKCTWPHLIMKHANLNFTVYFCPHPGGSVPTRPHCLTGATCHNIQIRPHPPGQTSFYESICAPMHAKWVLMCFGADQSNRIQPHPPASGWTSRIYCFCPMPPFIAKRQRWCAFIALLATYHKLCLF
jgi:hypothetical protein